MKISQAVIDEIVLHAREDLPNECCGLISGSAGEAVAIHRTRNAENSPYRYSIHPMDQFRVMESIEEDGNDLAAIYHSHPISEAYPSQTDINLAELWPDPVYLICSLADPDSPEVRGFAIRDGGVEEVELAID